MHLAIFRQLLPCSRVVEQLEMQQGGLQRVSDWSRPFQLAHCGRLVSNLAACGADASHVLAVF